MFFFLNKKLRFSTEDFLSYLRRLTIILSMIYTVFTITLFIIASPSLMLKDSMDYGHYKMHPIIFVAAFASSLLSFLLHLGLQILFQLVQNFFLNFYALRNRTSLESTRNP